jgi:hypothetical protein
MAEVQLDERADRLGARYGDTVLFEYVYRPKLPPVLSPRPYFHPVRTLAGIVVTGHQPADHRWHLGLAYSWPVVSGWNLWGGPTYVRERGYVDLPNHGEIRHREWSGLEERLTWLGGDGKELAEERRTIGRPSVDPDAGAWSLDLACDVENRSGRPLRLGSPTTEGRPMAGYAGLAWRGTEALRGSAVLLEGDPATDPVMGARSRWLGCAGAGVTVAVLDHPSHDGAPSRWFVRTEEYLLVTSSPVFDHAIELPPGGGLALRHHLLFADGVWSRERVAARLRVRLDAGPAAAVPRPSLESPARPAGPPSAAAGHSL